MRVWQAGDVCQKSGAQGQGDNLNTGILQTKMSAIPLQLGFRSTRISTFMRATINVKGSKPLVGMDSL